MPRYSAFWSGPGGAVGNRTPDLVIANDALYQLSYSPMPEHNGVHPGRGFNQSGGQVKYEAAAFAFTNPAR